jgi:rSAM/selenodomain-associated transferase 2
MIALSIIIPTLNEAPRLKTLLPYLTSNARAGSPPEIIVADGGSTDGTGEVARTLGARVIAGPKGRASQMNAGAKEARGRILYFLHADTIPPREFQSKIEEALARRDTAGCFRLRFEPSDRFLDAFAWCSRLNLRICRGGDQSLFLPRPWFEALGGFDERYRIYEDNEFIGRLYRAYPFTVLPWEVTTSSRRYQQRGTYALQYHYAVVHLKKYLGASPESLYHYYKAHVLREPEPPSAS